MEFIAKTLDNSYICGGVKGDCEIYFRNNLV